VSSLVFAIVLVSCAYFVQGGGMNENSRYALVRAIVEDHSFRIDRFHTSTIDRAQFEGHWYSDKAPGLSLLAALPYALGARIAQPSDEVEPSPLALHLVTIATCALATATAAVVLLHLLVGLGVTTLVALLAVFGWVLGTNAFAYATLFYAHQLAASLLVLAVAGIRAAGREAAPRWYAFGAGCATGLAVISEYPVAVLALGLGCYGLATLGVRRMLPFVLGALIPVLLLCAYNTSCFGDPLHLGYQSLADQAFADAIASDFLGFSAPRLGIIGELLVFEYRGLLPLSPFLVLAAPGMWWMIRDRALRPIGILCATAFAGFVLLMSGYHFWSGGAAMGPRYLIPVLPFAIVPVAVAIDRLRALAPKLAIAAAVTLVAGSIAICTMCVAVKPEFSDSQQTRPPTPDIALPDQHHPITELAIPLFVRGHLSQKWTVLGQLGFSGQHPGHDDDAYNLGEAIGLPGLASLVPLLAAWIACGVAIGRRLRSRSRA